LSPRIEQPARVWFRVVVFIDNKLANVGGNVLGYAGPGSAD
jgi:hypothetical protein